MAAKRIFGKTLGEITLPRGPLGVFTLFVKGLKSPNPEFFVCSLPVAAYLLRFLIGVGVLLWLEFYAFESPFAQPRNFIASQVIATVVGVSLSRLFQLHSNEEWIRWLGGSLACAATTSLMGLTKTVHPPAGDRFWPVIDDRPAGRGKVIPFAL
ncbi:hypothetical protein RRF57_005254 [Xylaria bambusicola]|uniref:HPP transmembrane region domain-containing protein n=1 Tax=Xylaria bambusicola TaxID=326684 RepID=A0AAN7UXQ0_9PEZI